MKLRLRHKEKTVPLELNNETTLHMLKLQAKDCFNIDDVILSLNNRDPVEGDDESLSNLGIVSGDLVYVLSDCGQPVSTGEVQKSNCQLYPKTSSAPACSSHSESVIHSAVAKIETNTCTVDKFCIETVVNNAGDGDVNMECSGTVPEVLEKEQSRVSENMDSFADDGRQIVAEAGGTGEPHAMSTEDLLLVNRYLNEPMVIREATDSALPQTLVVAYSLVQPQTADSALLVVIDVLMSELGYQRTAESDMPVDWDLRSGSTFLNYTYPPLPHVKFQLLCVQMLGLLILHGLVRMSDDVIQKRTRLQLKTTEFILTDGGSLTYRGGRLAQLSRTFKDTVAYPMLQFAMQDDDTQVLPSLTTLVFELKMHILKYLKVGSLVQLSAVNRDFHCVARQPILWRRLYVKDFGRRSDMSLNQDWISMYKEEYGKRKKVRHMRHWDFPPVLPFMGPNIPDYPPVHPCYPPGFMIGGDYDLRPNVAPDLLRLPDPLRLSHNLAPDSVLGSASSLDDQLPSVLPAKVPSSITGGSGRTPHVRPHPASIGTRFRFF